MLELLRQATGQIAGSDACRVHAMLAMRAGCRNPVNRETSKTSVSSVSNTWPSEFDREDLLWAQAVEAGRARIDRYRGEAHMLASELRALVG